MQNRIETLRGPLADAASPVHIGIRLSSSVNQMRTPLGDTP